MNWTTTVDVHATLKAYDDHHSLTRTANEITSLFKNKGMYHGKLEGILLIMKDASELDDVEAFDDALEDLYTWADANKIWLGML